MFNAHELSAVQGMHDMVYDDYLTSLVRQRRDLEVQLHRLRRELGEREAHMEG